MITDSLKYTLNKQLQFQEELNIKTCGKNWKSGVTKDGKTINWRLCIVKEVDELIDSIPWKHWKDINDSIIDYKNIHVELVDAWHFILSDLLVSDLENSERVNIIQHSIEKANSEIIKVPINTKEKNKFIINNSLKLISEAAKINENLTSTSTLKNFFVLCKYCDLSLNSLFALYFGKNYLNEFRQLNGYKSGKYKKMWSKYKEDNAFMYDIVLNNPNISKDDLMSKFTEIYKELKSEKAA